MEYAASHRVSMHLFEWSCWLTPNHRGVTDYILDLESCCRGARYLNLTFASILLHRSWLCNVSLFQASAITCASDSVELGRVSRCTLFGVGAREDIWASTEPCFRVSLAYGRIGRTTINRNAWMMDMKGVPSFYTDMAMRREAEGSNQRCTRRPVIPDGTNQFTPAEFPRQRRTQIWKVERGQE
jgi:hypothetical protein